MKKSVLIALVLVIGALFLSRHKYFQQALQQATRTTVSKIKCHSDSQPVFHHYPTEIDAIVRIEPPLMEIAGNLKGHSYINVTKRVPVYAPADAVLLDGVKYREEEGGRGNLDQYLLHFQVSCEVTYYFDHLIDPPAKIARELIGPVSRDSYTRALRNVEIKEGEFLGYSAGQRDHNFDFGVMNTDELRNIVGNYDHIDSPKYQHASCPYKYFKKEIREKLFSLIEYGGAADLVVIENVCQ